MAVRVVLTGGIGAGKSTVAAALQGCGASVFDADAQSRLLTGPGGAALEPIARAFGADVLDATGALDRARMRQLVFEDPARRRLLESILHPLIAAAAHRAMAGDDGAGSTASAQRHWVLDIPLLHPASAWRTLADRVLVVDCSPATQVQRVMARSGLAAPEVERIISAQIARPVRLGMADAVIVNEGISLQELHEQVRAVWNHWVGTAPSKTP